MKDSVGAKHESRWFHWLLPSDWRCGDQGNETLKCLLQVLWTAYGLFHHQVIFISLDSVTYCLSSPSICISSSHVCCHRPLSLSLLSSLSSCHPSYEEKPLSSYCMWIIHWPLRFWMRRENNISGPSCFSACSPPGTLTLTAPGQLLRGILSDIL